ncbi:nuclear transport factor 2 family protein [Algoriphagus halophytocola]|uniref:Nuclear transport factor 2 family protein n=1 Tax=Algoriphagus halophytocola TaxID=2991499 RepID=A0ABY6MKH6_9BACT|nr:MULTISPECIES: nuclear transport factor 2 family protein [unclassified Algoriphagus]UZD22781.1 nuclear transport factor 2 family protein [Algoriphagus sp. TR-M5]WBL44047.1 nuclear transport factor 2 family protein [Algoriphagus sp. TR-M9]
MKSYFLLLAVFCTAFSCSPKNEELKETPTSEAEVPKLNYDEQTTQQVLDHHFKAFVENNLEEVMADYTEESILITPDRTYRGLAEIRENFVNAYAALPKDSTTVNLIKDLAIKDVGYIIWEADAPNFEFKSSSDTFIIQDGKIVRQTFMGVVTAK